MQFAIETIHLSSLTNPHMQSNKYIYKELKRQQSLGISHYISIGPTHVLEICGVDLEWPLLYLCLIQAFTDYLYTTTYFVLSACVFKPVTVILSRLIFSFA